MIFKEYLNKKFYFNLSIVLIIFFLDRITKKIIIHLNQENFGQYIFSSEYLNISLVWNKGIAFGLLSFNENYPHENQKNPELLKKISYRINCLKLHP